MGRIIKGQIIASTELDSHGERLTRDQLEDFLQQFPDPHIINDSHDLSRPPIAIGYNKRIDNISNGIAVLKIDIEVINEDTFQKHGGFSISYSRNTIRVGVGDPIFNILINPRQFDFESTARGAIPLVRLGTTIDIIERIEKAELLQDAIIIISLLGMYSAAQVVRGFFNAAGADIFRYFKKLIRRDNPSAPTEMHIHLELNINQFPIKVILIDKSNVTSKELAEIDFDNLFQQIGNIIFTIPINRVIGEIDQGCNIRLKYLISNDGETLTL
jgi:hypothetical protein